MRCTTVQDLLQAFLDGELDVETTLRMLKHLELCRACRARADVDRCLRTAVVCACREPLGPAERHALVEGACGVANPRAWGRAWIVGVVVLVVLLTALVVITRS